MKDKEIAERLNMGYKLAKYSPDVFLMYQHRFEKSTMTKWKAFLDGGAIFKYEENLRLTEEKKVAEQKAIDSYT